MKKLIIFIFLLCTIAFWVSKMLHKEKVSPLLLNNIEAIAGGESSSHVRCFGTGSVNCSVDNSKVERVVSGYSLEIQY